MIRYAKIISGPLTAVLICLFCDLEPGNSLVTKMAGIAAWMAIWWLTEVIDLAVTALLPLILMPVLGIADAKTVASQYMDNIIFLFIGGFIIAFAIERWNLHRRIALKILMTVGTKPQNILLGVMLTAYLLSMWISNTATVMMLFSAVIAIVYQVEQHLENEKHKVKIASALLIGLAYAATIGGMATLVGTPTNMIFLKMYKETFPLNDNMNFMNWFIIGFPVSLTFVFVAFFVLKKFFIGRAITLNIDKKYFEDAYKKLGKPVYEEKMVFTIFVITAILWFTRSDIAFGGFTFIGWGSLFKYSKFIDDSTVAIVMATLLFLIPSKTEKGRALITWEEASRLPFDVILLFGGGFALAKGFELSGLSNWMASKLAFESGTSIYLILISMCLLVTIISEFASNVACIQLMIPILLSMQKVLNIHPLLLLVPATLAASLGFMLPVATAPNTIVFGSKRIKAKDMMKVGFVLDIAGIGLIVCVMALIGVRIWK